MAHETTITFMPGAERVSVSPGRTLAEAAQLAGLELGLPCGGRGTCGKCLVRVTAGVLAEPTDVESERLSAEQLAQGWRLACQARVSREATVEVAAASRVIGAKVLEAELLQGIAPAPNVRQYAVEPAPPTLLDQRSDWRRLSEGLSRQCLDASPAPDVLRALPTALRDSGFQVVATCIGGRVADVRPAGQASRCLGVAIDVGTTTVVSYIVDLRDGAILSSAALHNPQTRHGADVVSRIEYSNSNAEGLATLHSEAVGVVNATIRQALAPIGASPSEVFEATVVGNTCMHHLLLGLAPRFLAETPYVPVIADPVEAPAADLGIEIHRSGSVFCLPCIAGFVGADTVGMIVAEGLTKLERPCLAVDIGTNGEVALWSGSELLVASCAAGPAFEGAQIEHGMRAAPGAIDHVRLEDGRIALSTIEGAPARGICGSGLFDAVAVALELGAVDMMGRFATDGDSLRAGVGERLIGEGNARRLLLTEPPPGNGEVALTQRDVREVQLAKGAILAAITLLLEEASLRVADLDQVLIAGAFGNYIAPASALRIGLLPQVPIARVRGVGNAAGAGAILALVSLPHREYACQVAAAARHVELMRKPQFQMTFAETMLFPSL